MIATVLGWYDHGNIGDESYKLTFKQLIPDVPLHFTDYLSDSSEYGTCILGGGDVLSIENLTMLSRAKPSKKYIVSAMASANTPFRLLSDFDGIFVRDHRSQHLLTSHGIESSFMPDLAFFLKANPEKGRQYINSSFKNEKLDLYDKRIGVIVNAYLGTGSESLSRDFISFQKLSFDLAHIADTTSASFVFIPMSTRSPFDDRWTNGAVASKCKFWQKNLVVHDRLDVQETLDLISSMDAVVSTRLHSSIFSMISNVPFIDLFHHDKNKCFLDTVGLSHYGYDYWSFDRTKISGHLSDILKNPWSYKEELSRAYQKQLEILLRTSDDFSLS